MIANFLICSILQLMSDKSGSHSVCKHDFYHYYSTIVSSNINIVSMRWTAKIIQLLIMSLIACLLKLAVLNLFTDQ